MNFDLFEKKMNEAFAILENQKKNTKATQKKYDRVLENKREAYRIQLEAEMLGKLSDAEIEHKGRTIVGRMSAETYAAMQRDEDAFNESRGRTIGVRWVGD